jgi:LysM repeat protein
MSLVVPCSGQANCYVYTVRGGGPPPTGNGSGTADNLSGIANFFGVKIAKIYSMNPGVTAKTGVHAGQQLKIPPPTR